MLRRDGMGGPKSKALEEVLAEQKKQKTKKIDFKKLGILLVQNI